jgi:uncharacterized membrane protein YkoI
MPAILALMKPRRLHDAGTIAPYEKLNANALAKHPGATITDTELEEKYGKFIYQVDLRDRSGARVGSGTGRGQRAGSQESSG